jgi:hypothetical protein
MRQSSLLHDVADTSIQVYRDVVVPTKETRQRRVLIALANCPQPVTAYELFRLMKRHQHVSDLNDVRPRLTELWKAGKVERCDKRPCDVTGHTAYCWRLR